MGYAEMLTVVVYRYEKVLSYIPTAKTEKGLRVRAYLLPKRFATGVKVAEEQVSEIKIRWGRVLTDWNDAIRPREREHGN